jgi:hypothetical protein
MTRWDVLSCFRHSGKFMPTKPINRCWTLPRHESIRLGYTRGRIRISIRLGRRMVACADRRTDRRHGGKRTIPEDDRNAWRFSTPVSGLGRMRGIVTNILHISALSAAGAEVTEYFIADGPNRLEFRLTFVRLTLSRQPLILHRPRKFTPARSAAPSGGFFALAN